MFNLFSAIISIIAGLILFEDKQSAVIGAICTLGAMQAIAARLIAVKSSMKLDALLKKAGFSEEEIEKI